MVLLPCAATVCFDADLKIYDLSRSSQRPAIIWEERERPTGLDPFTLAYLKVSSTPSLYSFLSDTMRYIEAYGVLKIDEAADARIDALVERRTRMAKSKPIN